MHASCQAVRNCPAAGLHIAAAGAATACHSSAPQQLGAASLRHTVLGIQLVLQRLELRIAGIPLVNDG